jgi:vacuolar protein sorting-associated protein IST1
LIDKLSVRNPGGEYKLKIMKEIAKEFQVDWDTTETEQELLKPQEESIVCLLISPLNFLFHYSKSES